MTPRPGPAILVAVLAVAALATGCADAARSQDGGPDAAEVEPVTTSASSPSSAPSLESVVERLEACDRSRPATSTPPSSACAHLVYAVSASMPLSEEGLPEIRRAAAGLGLELGVIREAALLEPATHPRAETLRGALVDAGATLHFPSLTVLVDGEVQGTALVGYKPAEAWEMLLRKRLRGMPPARREASGPTTPGPEHQPDIEVLWTHAVEPAPGAFFRRVPGTGLIVFDQRGAVHLRDLDTGRQFRGPGWIDFVPTPDGRLFVTPGEANSGLEFYLAGEVIERGAEGTAEAVEPFLRDREMNDQYPSVGILEDDAEAGRTRYRVLVSWFAGLAFRDYDVHWTEEGPPQVEALTEKLTACPGRDLSTPILSKDGREVAARDEGTGTTKLFRLNDDASCTELLDLGRQTSKVGFSDDGVLVAYSSPESSSRLRGTRSTTYVLDRSAMETLRIPHSESAGLVIPEFVGPDSLLIAVRETPGNRAAEFRLLCCVR